MISHAAITVSSLENAKEFFEYVMKFKFLYNFGIDKKTARSVFGIDSPTVTYVYRTDEDWIEVFIIKAFNPTEKYFNHICFRIDDIPGVVLRGEERGYKFTRFRRKDHTVLFITDKDGNFFELKKNNDS